MILGHAVPLGNAFFALLALPALDAAFAARYLLALVRPGRKLSAERIAHARPEQPRHRGNVLRFLRHWPAGLAQDWLEAAFGNLLLDEPADGTWLFVLDQTYCGHQSARLENAFSTAHRGRRQKHARKHNRAKRKQQQQRFCHCFIFGLLLTPSGLRLPAWLPYYTQEYCQAYGKRFRKQTEVAAELIDRLRVPAAARVVVVGDTAFDADPIHAACRRRRFRYVVSLNGDRRLEQAPPRPQVVSLAAAWAADQYQPVRLTPGQGAFVAQRRSAACRVGPGAKARTFYVHEERCAVANLGRVRVVFSTKRGAKAGQAVKVQKALVTDDLESPVADIIEIYDLRWQIELLFKELKGRLGLADYRFGRFRCVEGWVNLCVLGFLYLEWYRRQRLRETADRPQERARWQWQRSHGLCEAVRQDVEWEDLQWLRELLERPGGAEAVRDLLRQAVPKEYRKAG
jgi:Transposase DDE domain